MKMVLSSNKIKYTFVWQGDYPFAYSEPIVMRNLILKTFLFAFVLLTAEESIGQLMPDSVLPIMVRDINKRYIKIGDSFFVISGICKPLKVNKISSNEFESRKAVFGQRKTSLFSATGEFSFTGFSRIGSVDSLFLLSTRSKNYSLRLNILYKEHLPLNFSVRYNKTSPFQIESQFEFNLGFDEVRYRELAIAKLYGQLNNRFIQEADVLGNMLLQIQSQYDEQVAILESSEYIEGEFKQRLKALAGNTNSTGINQSEISRSLRRPYTSNRIFENESANAADKNVYTIPKVTKNLANSLSLHDKNYSDSLSNHFKSELHKELLKRRDSLYALISKYQDSLKLLKDKYSLNRDSLQRELSALYTTDDLKKFARKKGLDSSYENKKIIRLLTGSNFRFGKFILNNSELTISNIFLKGFSLKFGSSVFFQVSGGLYDFAFRNMYNLRSDSFGKNGKSVLGFKVGKTDGRNLKAFNFYVGQKSNGISASKEIGPVAGFSYEQKTYLAKDLKITLELAKSTPKQSGLDTKDQAFLKSLFGRFSNKTIGGYAAVSARIRKTKTDAELNYRYWGSQFESFNGSQYFNPKNNFSAKIGQPFFKRKVFINSGIRYSDFSSYGIGSNIRSKTVFGSVAVTMRFKKLPILSIGYYPGSQLYWTNGNGLYEYFYYILNGSASHYFSLGKMPMQVMFTYNRFLNKYADSLLSTSQSYYSIYWNGWYGKCSYAINMSQQVMESSRLRSLEAGLNYSAKRFKIGGSVKGNQLSDKYELGYSINCGINLSKFGSLSIMYDKSFLPDRGGLFLPVNTGQILFIKPLNISIWQRG